MLSDWDGKPVKKWIIDDRDTGNNDGWVWWGYYIAPGEQTGNFLDGLSLIEPSDDKMYYAIHADMQAVSYEELTRWEEENDMSGNDRIVDALRRSKMKVSAVTINEKPTEIMRGTTFNFSAKVQGSAGVNKAVAWSLLGYSGTQSSIDQNGVLTVGAAETETILTVCVTCLFSYNLGKFLFTTSDNETLALEIVESVFCRDISYLLICNGNTALLDISAAVSS